MKRLILFAAVVVLLAGGFSCDTENLDWVLEGTEVVLLSVQISPQGDQSNLNVGGTATFVIQVSNDGQDVEEHRDANTPFHVNVGIADEAITPVAGTPVTSGSTSWDSTNKQWTIPSLAKDATETLTITLDLGDDPGSTQSLSASIVRGEGFPADPNHDDDSATQNFVIAGADLHLVKTASPTAANPGDNVTFTIVLSNQGSHLAENIVVTDALPSAFQLQNHDTTQGTYAGNTWNVGDLDNGATATLTLETTLQAGVAAGSTPTNMAGITSVVQGDPDDTDNSDEAIVTVNSADLTVTKVVRGGNTSPDELTSITYDITVENNGPHTATGIELEDQLHAGLSYQNAISSVGTINESSGLVTWNGFTLNNAESATLSITVQVNPGTSGTTIPNTAEIVNLDQADGNPGNDGDYVEIVPASLDLAVSKTASNPTPKRNEPFTWIITAQNLNASRDATGVTVIDTVPAEFVVDLGNSTWPNGTSYASGVWTIGQLDRSSSLQLVLAGSVDQAFDTVVENNVSISGDQIDPTTANDTDSATVTIAKGDVDLALTMTEDTNVLEVGETVSIDFTVTNSLTSDEATNVQVSITYADFTLNSSTYAVSSGVWSIASLPANGSITNTIVFQATAAGQNKQITGNVTTSDQNESNPSDNSPLPVVIDVNAPAADLILVVTNEPAGGVPQGSEVTVTYQLNNLQPGNVDATNIQVDLSAEVGLTIRSATPTGGSYDQGSKRWSLPSLLANQGANSRKSITVVYYVELGTADVGDDELVASIDLISLDQTDPDGATASSAINPDVGQADLEVTAFSADVTTLDDESSMAVVTLTLTNNGPHDTQGVQVTLNGTGDTNEIEFSGGSGDGNLSGSVWSLDDPLDSGSSQTLTFNANFAAGSTTGATGTLAATVTANDQGGTPTHLSPITFTLREAAALSLSNLTITSPGNSIGVNTQVAVSLDITLDNAGPDDADGVDLDVRITDTNGNPVSVTTTLEPTGTWTGFAQTEAAAPATLSLTLNLEIHTAGDYKIEVFLVDANQFVPGLSTVKSAADLTVTP